VPRGGVRLFAVFNGSACPTFANRPIESQWIFLRLSHQFSAASHVRFSLISGHQQAQSACRPRAQNEKSGPGNCHSCARVHRGCRTRQAVSTELVTTIAGVRDRFNFDQSRRLGTSSRLDDGNVVEGSDAPTVLFLCQDQLQTRAVSTVASARMPGGNLV
jgi:hypothetical protein